MNETNLMPATERLLRDFAHQPGVTNKHVQTLREVIGTSPALTTQIATTLSSGRLQKLEVLDQISTAAGEYHARWCTIKLRLDVLATPGTTSFILGHEIQHALNSRAIARAIVRFHAAAARAATTTRDYTAAVEALIKANRWDESSANLAGWNALVGHVRSKRRHARLVDIVQAAPSAAPNFVIGRGRRTRFSPSLSTDPDFTIPLSSANIEAMGRKYFDASAALTRIGARGTSDYANYYAAWAIGQIERPHNAVSPGQPMQIDLERIGLSRKLMEEVGIDLHGRRRQPYVDASTQPTTRDFFHDTIGTFTYVPPAASDQDRSTQQAWEAVRLAAVRFARPSTDATRIQMLCGPAAIDRAPAARRKVAQFQRSA